jgi:hypothetical protein
MWGRMRSGSKPERLSWVTWLLLLVILSAGIYGISKLFERSDESPPGLDLEKPITVEELIQNIARYRGYVQVEGEVIRSDSDESGFSLVSRESGAKLPVSYRGAIPPMGERVIAAGKLVLDEGERYIFEATRIKAR